MSRLVELPSYTDMTEVMQKLLAGGVVPCATNVWVIDVPREKLDLAERIFVEWQEEGGD